MACSQERLAKFRRVAASRTKQLTIVLDGVFHPHNISAVLRSADAFGLHSVHAVRCREDSDGLMLLNPIAKGSEKWLKIYKHDSAESCLAELEREGFEIVTFAPEEDSRQGSIRPQLVEELPFEKKLALVFGNERRGVTPIFWEKSHYRAFIPMFGFVESLNVSVAVAISLYASTLAPLKSSGWDEANQRRRPLSAQEQEELVEDWVRQEFTR